MDISKKLNENEVDYHKRLIYGKLVDRTLSDIDYSELAELVYGQQFSSDVARRMMYGSKRTLELIDRNTEKLISEERILSDLDTKKMELQAERKRLYDQRRELNKIITETGRSEHLEECLIAAADNLRETIGSVYFDDNDDKEIIYGKENEAILILSDWHYGMKTDNIWNRYDTEICKDRVSCIINKTMSRIKLHKCGKIHIVVLGDLCHGAIHTSARVASEELVCDQIMNSAELLAQAIEYLSDRIDEVNVYMTYGNHARTVQKKDDNIHRDNMERIIPWWLKQRLKYHKNINIVSDFEHELMFFEVCGCGFCATHGDLDNIKSSPKLLSTLMNKKYGKNVDYILLADKHHRESFEELGVSAMICGSLCGVDEYANNKRLYSLPEQLLLIASADIGVDAEYHLRCN